MRILFCVILILLIILLNIFWIKDFIDYTSIINDNLKTFPCEALGIDRKEKDTINYTNIVKM